MSVLWWKAFKRTYSYFSVFTVERWLYSDVLWWSTHFFASFILDLSQFSKLIVSRILRSIGADFYRSTVGYLTWVGEYLQPGNHILYEFPSRLGSAAAADILIAISLCWSLSKNRTGFHQYVYLITRINESISPLILTVAQIPLSRLWWFIASTAGSWLGRFIVDSRLTESLNVFYYSIIATVAVVTVSNSIIAIYQYTHNIFPVRHYATELHLALLLLDPRKMYVRDIVWCWFILLYWWWFIQATWILCWPRGSRSLRCLVLFWLKCVSSPYGSLNSRNSLRERAAVQDANFYQLSPFQVTLASTHNHETSPSTAHVRDFVCILYSSLLIQITCQVQHPFPCGEYRKIHCLKDGLLGICQLSLAL